MISLPAAMTMAMMAAVSGLIVLRSVL
jgi:hypothetical protein